jgi:PhnB protein
MTPRNFIHPGFHTATPYLIARDAARAIDFYKQAFAATEQMRHADPDGKVQHAEIRIGDSPFMLADEFPEVGARSPEAFGGSPVSFLLYVEDADTVFARALAAGAKQLSAVEDKPFGHVWYIATHTGTAGDAS